MKYFLYIKNKFLIIILLLSFIFCIREYKDLIYEYLLYHKIHDDSRSQLIRNSRVENKKLSDPLGQEAKINGSIPIPLNHEFNKEKMNLIKRVQLNLLLQNYYNKEINGVMNKETIRSIINYQKDNSLNTIHTNYLDRNTLNSLGVVLND